MHDEPVIAASGLTVVRGKITALRDLAFQLGAGKLIGLIGPSGSGKTTLMRAIVGTQQITRGEIKVLGLPAGSKQLRARIGYVTQSPAVYQDLTARQNLWYFASILGLPKSEADAALKAVDLSAGAKQLVGTMSGGQRARVSLAVALLGKPDLLVLDEPTVGLDPVLRKRLWELFAELAAQGRTLLISSHVMDEAEQCPELLMLRDGKLLMHGTKKELFERTGTRTVHDAFLKLAEGEQ
ncbi:ABC transporter ATP-binding protein [Candidatus Saccharibacteria bacterium]|nr:ABC transporter ATP-binding protein [Candidatus Saccharibacteria bacterium]